jgi:hypothetical protein
MQGWFRVGSGCSALGHDPLAEPMERHSVRRGFFQGSAHETEKIVR